MNDRYNIPNVEKAMRVLEHLSEHPNGRSIRELVDDLDIPKTGIYRLVTTLTNLEYLRCDNKSGRFQLTRKLLAMGNSIACPETLLEPSLEAMYELRDQCTETVQLNTIAGHHGVILEFIPALHPIRLMIDAGTRFELHCTAPGKAILAFMPEDQRNEILAKMDFPKHQENTISDRDDFIKELDRVRDCGYGIDISEGIISGLLCVSAPIFDHRSYPVAALTISAPSIRVTEKDLPALAEMTLPQARRISKRLGHGLV